MYNKGMGGVDLIDQRAVAYHLDQKPTIRFYLHIFFKHIFQSFAIFEDYVNIDTKKELT